MLDLFGSDYYDNCDDLFREYLSQKDKDSIEGRIRRLKHLHNINQDDTVIAGDLEFAFAYREAQFTFVEGFFLSTILLTQSFIEKLFQSYFDEKGIKCKRTFSSMLTYAKDNKIISNFIYENIDYLRRIRNPITHIKNWDYTDSLSKRSLESGKDPNLQLEEDAKFAIELFTQIGKNGFI